MTIEARVKRLEKSRGINRNVRSARDFTTPELMALVADIVPAARSAATLDDIDELELLTAIESCPDPMAKVAMARVERE